MAKDSDEKPKRVSKGSFWTITRIAFIAIFLAGLALGGLFVHQFVEPVFNAGIAEQLNDCNSFRSALDEQLELCNSCLGSQGIVAESCTLPPR